MLCMSSVFYAYLVTFIEAIVARFRYFYAYLYPRCGVKVISIIRSVNYFFGDAACFYRFGFVGYVFLQILVV